MIVTSFGRRVDTVKRWLANTSSRKAQSDAGVMKSITDRDLRNFESHLFKKSGLTSRTTFEHTNVSDVPKSTRCRLLRGMRKNIIPAKCPPPDATTQGIAVGMDEKFMKTDMELIIFTDETRATLNGSDGWGRVWIANCQERHCRCCQQGG